MEKVESGCVLLKQKEYDELLKKVKDNSPKHIIVHYGYTGYYPYREVNMKGDIVLSNKIDSQLRRIIGNLENKFRIALDNNIEKERKQLSEEFSKLCWYDRLFYKPKK